MSRWCCFPLLFVVLFILVNQPQQTDGAAIPIWELLKHEEKVKYLHNLVVGAQVPVTKSH
jgi:hypothetical protein